MTRKALTDTGHIDQFVFAKPLGPIGDERSALNGGINAIDRQRDLVDAAALAQLDQQVSAELRARTRGNARGP